MRLRGSNTGCRGDIVIMSVALPAPGTECSKAFAMCQLCWAVTLFLESLLPRVNQQHTHLHTQSSLIPSYSRLISLPLRTDNPPQPQSLIASYHLHGTRTQKGLVWWWLDCQPPAYGSLPHKYSVTKRIVCCTIWKRPSNYLKAQSGRCISGCRLGRGSIYWSFSVCQEVKRSGFPF